MSQPAFNYTDNHSAEVSSGRITPSDTDRAISRRSARRRDGDWSTVRNVALSALRHRARPVAGSLRLRADLTADPSPLPPNRKS